MEINMKVYFALTILLLACFSLGAELTANFTLSGSFDFTQGYCHAEVDSVLNLYSYVESGANMQIIRRRFSPHWNEVVTDLLWEYPLSSTLITGPLVWHRAERRYGKLWIYLSHTNWLGAISMDATGAVQLYQINTPITYNCQGDRFLHHFGEGQIYFSQSGYIWRWELNPGLVSTILQIPDPQRNDSLQRLGDEYLISSYTPGFQPLPCYLIDSNHNLIQSNLNQYYVTEPHKIEDGVYWVKFHHEYNPWSYGSGTLWINDAGVNVGVWNEYDSMFDGYGESKPILNLPDSRFLCDQTHVNSSGHEYHYFRVRQHNGGNSFSPYTGIPSADIEAQTLRANYFNDKVLLLGWQSYPLENGFVAKMADLQTQTWIPVNWSEPPEAPIGDSSVLNNNEYIWFLRAIYNSGYNLKIYHGEFCVANDDPHVPAVNKISIWPNPAKAGDCLKLQSKVPIRSVKLYNLRGQMLQELDGAGHSIEELALAQLPSGIYLIRITDAENRLHLRKIVIKN